MEGDPCVTGDFHGKVKRHGMWMQQTLPVPMHMIFDEAYRKAGRIGHATADWDVSHGNRYDWVRPGKGTYRDIGFWGTHCRI
jgi:hypothetical protein